MKAFIFVIGLTLISFPALAETSTSQEEDDYDELIKRACLMRKDGAIKMEIEQYLTNLIYRPSGSLNQEFYNQAQLSAHVWTLIGVDKWERTKQCQANK